MRMARSSACSEPERKRATEVNTTKARIRSATLERRDALSADERADFSRRIVDRVMALEEFGRARSVMAYCGFGTEIDTLPLLRAVLESGKSLALPRVARAKNGLEIYQVGSLQEDLVPGTWGIPEPLAARCRPMPHGEIDLVLMPGVAFDRCGGRIGYGKGYYDRMLADCLRNGHRPITVAGLYELQLFERVPMESHDIPVDLLVTENKTMVAGRAGRVGPGSSLAEAGMQPATDGVAGNAAGNGLNFRA
jgi:5-formyltetrahydrofolate cyclo-ligase